MSDLNSASTKEIERPQSRLDQLSRLPKANVTFKELSGWLAFGVPVLYLLMAFVEASSYVWRPLSVVLYIMLLLFGVYIIELGNSTLASFFSVLPIRVATLVIRTILILLEKLDSNRFSGFVQEQGTKLVGELDEGGDELQNDLEKINLEHYSTENFAFTLLGGIVVLVGFSQVCRHLFILVGGFVSEGTGYWHWVRFGLSNLLESILFDIPAIYEWGVSEIRATSTWSRAVVFVFRLTIEFMVVAMILRQARIAPKKFRRQNDKHPNNFFALIVPKVEELILIALWGVPIAISIGAVLNDGFFPEVTWLEIKLSVPLVFGIWLGWQSLRGLGLPGVWNKVFALVGLVGGSWLAREYWLLLSTFLNQ